MNSSVVVCLLVLALMEPLAQSKRVHKKVGEHGTSLAPGDDDAAKMDRISLEALVRDKVSVEDAANMDRSSLEAFVNDMMSAQRERHRICNLFGVPKRFKADDTWQGVKMKVTCQQLKSENVKFKEEFQFVVEIGDGSTTTTFTTHPIRPEMEIDHSNGHYRVPLIHADAAEPTWLLDGTFSPADPTWTGPYKPLGDGNDKVTLKELNQEDGKEFDFELTGRQA